MNMDKQHSPDPAADPAQETAAGSGRRWRPTRRGFLIGLGVTGGLLALGVGVGATAGMPYARLQIAGMLDGAEGMPVRYPEDPWAWFEVLPDSRIRLYLSKVEMGQGVHTSLAQIAAEELGIAWEDLDVAMATTARDLGNAITSGSSTVSGTYLPLRQAAATLMAMLRQEAAAQMGVKPEDLVVTSRGFAPRGAESGAGGAPRDFASVVAAKQGDWEAPEQAVPLKDRKNFQFIGQSLPRRDFEAKLTGQAVYGYDARIEGMKYGAVARPPSYNGKLKAAAPGGAAGMPGVHKVVIADGFAGVVADTRAQAQAAVNALDLEWDPGYSWQQAELESMVTVGNGEAFTVQNVGDAGPVLERETTLAAEYRTPFAVHAHLEAQAALADVQPGGTRIWCSTQGQTGVQSAVAKALGLDAKAVEVIPTYLGGGFGRKVGDEVAIEAARLSQAAGVPVHVGWTRTEDIRYGYFRPPTHHQLAASLDSEGNLLAIEHRQASGDVAFDFLPNFLSTVMGADFGAYRGAFIRYAAPNKRTIAHRVKLPVRTGWWRGLGLLANTFAVESFMDELAHAAGADPLAFRLRHLHTADPTEARLAAVLKAAADLGGWETPAPEGRARGLACCVDVDTAVAMVAEVSVDRSTGKIRVHHVAAAMDPGLVVNPDGARAQVEGNIMWGVGSALIEELTFADGQVVAGNFDGYPLLTMKDAPAVDVVLLDAGDGRPRGVGEPPIGPVAPAIANAFYALTGKRLRQLPMNSERVLAAL